MGACGKARIRPASLSLLLFVSLLVADRPTASAGNGGSPAINVAATGLAAHFSSHSSRLQLISIPGQWNGFNSSAAVTVEAWVKMTNYLQERAPIFMYSVRDPLGGSVSAKELGLEVKLDSTSRIAFPAWRYKGKLLIPSTEDIQPGAQSDAPSPPISGAPSPPTSPGGWPNTGGRPGGGGSGGLPGAEGGGWPGAAPGGSGAPAAPPITDEESIDVTGGCTEIFKCGNWNHIVATFDFVSGEYAIYVNGSAMYTAVLPDPQGAPLAEGVFHLGADILPAGQPSRLMAHQISDFSIDVLRMYDRALSAEEVSEALWAAEPDANVAPNLFLDWRFDNPLSDSETDLSGRGNHGQWGVSYDLNYPHIFKLQVRADISLDTVVSAPQVVLSNAPIRKATTLSALVVPQVPVELLLSGNSSSSPDNACALLSIPNIGLAVDLDGSPVAIGRALPNCILWYTAPPAEEWPAGSTGAASQLLASFRYQQGSGPSSLQGTASVYGTTPCEPTQRSRMDMLPFKLYPVLLGGTCSDGQQAVVELVSAPATGVVLMDLDQDFPFAIQALASFGQASTVPPDETWTASTPANFITTFPAILSNTAGYVFLVTAKTLESSVNTWVDFRWTCPFANTSAVSRLPIFIEKMNQPPAVLPLEFTPAAGDRYGGLLGLQLRSMDSDGTPYLSGSPVVYHITRGPKFGKLYQMEEDSSRGLELSRYGLSAPKVDYYASTIPAYTSDWGPSWTTQASGCSRCCLQQATCSSTSCIAVGHFQPICPVISGSFHIENLLGDDTSTVYKAGCTACGRQSFVVGFNELMYISGVKLYENGVAGAVTSLQAATDYEGSRTQWVDLWHANGEVQAEETWSVKEWSPRLCPYYPDAVQWLRVEFDTDSLPSKTVGFVKVLVMGSLRPPENVVHGIGGRLLYQPTPGVFPAATATTWDDVEVTASDCDVRSEQTVLPIGPRAVEGLVDSTFEEPQVVTVPVGSASSVEVDLSVAVAHLTSVMPESVVLEDFTVEARLQEGANSVVTKEDGGAVTPGARTSLGTKRCVTVQPSRELLNGSEELLFLATARGVTYRLLMTITAVCPKDASMFECATNADVCVTGCTDSPLTCAQVPYDATISYDPVARMCVVSSSVAPANKELSQSALIPIIAVLSVLIVTALFVLLCLKKRALLKVRLGGPPLEGDSVTLVTTDIHGSTTLWDAFPEQVARDIALHHECMRANLKPCAGYEIATEGDSFKCAFGTAEDAICWSVMVQLDLLCAPWSEGLEDGGHGVLGEQEDWANCTAPPVVSEPAQGVISALTASDKMQQIRSELATGALMQPLFNPSLIMKRSSDDHWSAAYGEGKECRVVYGPQSLLLPIFRGPRVRIGIHTGTATSVSINPVTKRLVYAGEVASIAKAVSDAPCGGQIVMSGETLAEVRSMQDLSKRVALMCAGWRHGAGWEDPHTPAGISVMSLGSHLLKPAPPPKKQSYSSSTTSMPWNVGAGSDVDASSPSVGSGSLFSSGTFHGGDNSLHGDVPRLHNITAILPPSVTDVNAFRNGDMTLADVEEAGTTSASSNAECDRLASAQNELRHAQELIMLVPWPLKARALFYPPVSTHKQLTSPWSEAPPAKAVTILFTFVEGVSELKAALPEEMIAEAMQQLQAVVRTALCAHHGYEVEVEEGNFVCAFSSAYDAAEFGMSCQVSLMAVNWHPMLLSQPRASEQLTLYGGGHIFRGIRLAIGMCTGNALRVQPCLRTGKMEYYGPIMNHAARVAVAAHGGQVLLHESSWNEIVGGERGEPDRAVFVNMGRHELKGVTRTVYIIQAVADELSARTFPPIRSKSKQGKKASAAAAARSFKSPNPDLDRYLYDVGAVAEAPLEDDEAGAVEKSKHSGERKSMLGGPLSMNKVKPVRQVEADGWLLKGVKGITSKPRVLVSNRILSISTETDSRQSSGFTGNHQRTTADDNADIEAAMEAGRAEK